MSQEIITLKLSDATEIIARTEDRTDDEITVSKAMMVGLTQGPDGGVGIQMMPWVASNQDGNVIIFTNQIVAETRPHPEIEKGYIKQTTGIALA